MNNFHTSVLLNESINGLMINPNGIYVDSTFGGGGHAKNILNKLPVSASNLYAKNLFNFILNLYDKKNNKININLEDEIINKTLVK